MHRFALPLLLLAAAAIVLPEPAPAQTDEFELPPVRLKPDRPSQAKPIPPTPDDREAEPSEKEVEEPEKAPPVKEGEEGETTPPETPDTGKAEPPDAMPLKPETREDGEPPTPADLPMPEAVAEPSEGSPATIALPAREVEPATPPDVPRTEDLQPRPTRAQPRPSDVQAEAMEAQVRPSVEPRLAGMGEVGLVEAVAAARKQYERTLEALKAYYVDRGHNAKIEWVESELRGYAATPKPRYLLAAEIAGPELRPARPIEAADQLYEEGMHFKNYPAFPPGKKDYLKVALEKFRTIIEKYPQSDKIDDAAFRMGEIYGGWYFQDYARAVMSYERCWQWNPETQHPARFKAAKIFEEKLKNRAKAVELYNEVIARTQDEELAKQAQERIRALTGR